jgi:hypothetical protein
MKRSELTRLLQNWPPAGAEHDPEIQVELYPGHWTTVPIIGIRNGIGGPPTIVLTVRGPSEWTAKERE